MESISGEGTTKWTPDTVTDATTLLFVISMTDFISALLITTECLNYLLALTRNLQAIAKYILQAVSESNGVKAAL